MPSHPSARNIQRIAPTTSGQGGYWRVKVSRPGVRYDARFADSRYASPEHAQRAAQAFLDLLLPRLPDGPRVDGDGLPGTVRRRDKPTPMWAAQLTLGEIKYSKSFSISRHGEAAARNMALDTRNGWIKLLGLECDVTLPSKKEIDALATQIRRAHNERPAPKAERQGFNSDAMYGITRREADESGKNGYWIAVIRRNGQTHRKQFGDKAHGGTERAFAVATSYRDGILQRFDAMPKREKQEIVTERNTSGHAGVFPLRKAGVQIGWGAQLVHQGKTQRKFFSANQGGFDHALELAIQARKQMLVAVQGEWVLSPAAKKPKPQRISVLSPTGESLVEEDAESAV